MVFESLDINKIDLLALGLHPSDDIISGEIIFISHLSKHFPLRLSVPSAVKDKDAKETKPPGIILSGFDKIYFVKQNLTRLPSAQKIQYERFGIG